MSMRFARPGFTAARAAASIRPKPMCGRERMFDRRRVLRSLGSLAAGMAGAPLAARAGEQAVLPFANGERPLVQYPGKRPLIVLTSRPPQLETPFSVFDEGIFTPNDAFFVRYHLADIPLKIDPDAF